MKTKYCLNSITSFHDINQSPTNRSKSKQTFSFCKTPRFENIQPNCPKNTYNRDVIERKASGISIGRGDRSDFTKVKTSSPGVSRYNLKSFFDDNNSRARGYSLRISRNQSSIGNYLNKQSTLTPPPTRYNTTKPQLTRSPSYNLRMKTNMPDKSKTIESQNNNPGPGNYENPEIDVKSRYSSKYSINGGYTTTRAKRFRSEDNYVPGPGRYEDVSKLSKVGKYVLSNHIGGTKAAFDHSKRVSKFQQLQNSSKQNPGPGSYRQPSQFGHYDNPIPLTPHPFHTTRYRKRPN